MSEEKKFDLAKLEAYWKNGNRRRSTLFRRMKKHSKDIEELSKRIDFTYEDRMYRFYHYSMKVYWLQEVTAEIVKLLKKINPHKDKHFTSAYAEILAAGTGKKFVLEHNKRWTFHTRPIVEAFLHSKYFLDMMARSITMKKEPKPMIPSGWAAILELYDLR